ncbi:unnamed protein product, partial [Amoebophrya sp. A120]
RSCALLKARTKQHSVSKAELHMKALQHEFLDFADSDMSEEEKVHRLESGEQRNSRS